MDAFNEEAWPASFDDEEIDEIIWSEIKDSTSRGDFVSYMIHRPRIPGHRPEAQKRLEEVEMTQSEPTGYERAVKKIYDLAEGGDPAAMFHIGKMYVHGIGVPQSMKEAEAWYLRAIAVGEMRAHCNMGWLYLYGFDTIPQNKEKAYELLSVGAENGIYIAKASIGIMALTGDGVPQDVERGLHLLEEAFTEGYTNAGNHLADVYFLGQHVPQDNEKGVAWLEKVVERGDERTMAILGHNLIIGAYGKTDAVKGVALLQQSIEKNYVPAYLWIGNLYRHGQGLPRDLDMARAWFQKGLQEGNTGCSQALESLQEEMEAQPEPGSHLKH